MTSSQPRLALPALDPAEVKAIEGSSYPEAFRPTVAGRAKRRLGDALGLTHFGVNVTTIKPGSGSALRHWHSREDEFIYVLSGELVLVTGAGEQVLTAGMCAGFPASKDGKTGDGHQLINRGDVPATYLEVSNRVQGDEAFYPDVDLHYHGAGSSPLFTRKDGSTF